MSITHDIFNRPILLKEKSKKVATPVVSDEVDWRNPLVMGLDARTGEKIAAERRWAKFMTALREESPDTTWLSISQDSKHITTPHETDLIQKWFEKIIASSEWSFPETVIIMSHMKKDKRAWKIAIPKLEKELLPFSEPPMGLVLIPYRDKFSSGWKISVEEIFENEKAGMA